MSPERHELRVSGLACGYATGAPTLRDLEFALCSGDAICLLGPNGVGKTTLFKTLLGFLAPLAGSLTFDGADMTRWSRREYGRMLGYIPQAHNPSFAFSVREVVGMGRTPHMGGRAKLSRDDERVVDEALEMMGIEWLAERDYTELSGGERQMVLVARALAQQPAFLIMDEPTSSLDLGNQVRVLNCIKGLVREGFGVLMTTHDPNQAFLLDGQVICLGRQGMFARGRASDVLDEDTLGQLYGVRVGLSQVDDGDAGVLSCTPLLENACSADDSHVGARICAPASDTQPQKETIS